MQMEQANPQIYDQVELNKQMLEVLGIKNIGKLIPAAEDEKPKDPVSENMAIFNGKPVKAFIYQDHEAHIQTHMSAMQDPKIAQMMGQNPQAQAIMGAAQAHIAEHMAFAYRKQMEETLGSPLPAPNEEIPQEAEVELSRLVSKAAQQLLQKNQGEQAQQQAQQQQQDPLIQMQQQELQLKQQEAMAKAMKMKADAELDLKKLELEKEKLASQERIAGAEFAAKAVLDTKKETAKQELEKARMKQDLFMDGVRFSAEQADKQSNKDHEHSKLSKTQEHKLEQQAAQALHQQALQAQQQEAMKEQIKQKPKE
jgi:hypothetical protein